MIRGRNKNNSQMLNITTCDLLLISSFEILQYDRFTINLRTDLHKNFMLLNSALQECKKYINFKTKIQK